MNDYTPSEDQVRAAYVQFAHDDLCLNLDMAREDARRAIAKIKADAWTAAVDYVRDREFQDATAFRMNKRNPYRIEEEA